MVSLICKYPKVAYAAFFLTCCIPLYLKLFQSRIIYALCQQYIDTSEPEVVQCEWDDLVNQILSYLTKHSYRVI